MSIYGNCQRIFWGIFRREKCEIFYFWPIFMNLLSWLSAEIDLVITNAQNIAVIRHDLFA